MAAVQGAIMAEPVSLEKPKRLLRLAEVLARTGFRRATLYREIARGKFPKPVRLTERTSAWNEALVAEWIERKVGGEQPPAA